MTLETTEKKENNNSFALKDVDEVIGILGKLSTQQQMSLTNGLAPSHKRSDLPKDKESLEKFLGENPDMALKLITILLKQNNSLNKENELLSEIVQNDIKSGNDHMQIMNIFQEYLKKETDAMHPTNSK